jgi:glycosyltransferase involved in cell wall biosynthesis
LYGLPFDTEFKFYSIFQWIDRKNPRGLLRAYWKAFEGNDKVCLILKTYGQNYSPNEYERIKKDIEKWKKELGLKSYPKIFLVKKLMTNHEIKRLHATGDCYVASSSGEGWNRPVQEAMLYGKPVISGDVGGITDLMKEYYKVESKSVLATEQSQIPWYTHDMSWKELDEKSLTEQMKFVYSNYKEAKALSGYAQHTVVTEFSFQYIGQMMKTRLQEIYEAMQ